MRALLCCLVPLTITLAGCGRDAAPAPVPAPSVIAPGSAGVAAAAAAPAAVAPGDLAVGAVAPDFTSKAHDGFDVHVSALKGKPIVLYFYPKDETPGCTKEACSFRDAWKDLDKTGVVLVGISMDDEASHQAFAKHHELPFHLVSDKDGAISKAYGVPNRAGFLSRQSFVIGADGKIKKIYRDVNVTTHAAEILKDVAPS